MNATDSLLAAAGLKFKLGSLDTNGDARVPTSREYAAGARPLGRMVTRARRGRVTWLVIDASLRDRAIGVYEASRNR